MKKIVVCIVASIFIGCLSTSEKDVVKTLERVYETNVTYNNSKEYCWVTLTSGKLLKVFSNELTAGNVAIYAYKNLSTQKRTTSTHIKVSLKEKDKTIDRLFSMHEIELPSYKASPFAKFSVYLKSKMYNEAQNMVSNDTAKNQQKAKELKQFIGAKISKNGAIKNFKRLGFGLVKKHEKNRYSYYGVLVFNNGKLLKYSIVVNPSKHKIPNEQTIVEYSFSANEI